MKRTAIILFVIALVLSLTSCSVNWFDIHYDVSWWTIAITVTFFVILVIIFTGKHLAKQKFVCPKCNQEFYPKWWQAALSIHIADDRLFKCPHCGQRGFCHISRK